ncbi:MAG: DUF86 domain-containing protein [Candidatus Aenigmarchaeota archaeon]|nr:DUF86 domain-containing protein [Candidatus Aenigmarchaeota archaeon]
MKDSRLYLKDILEAIEAIEKFIKDKDFETFRKNDMISSAVIRKLEIIGEASKNIPDDIRKKYPDMPWKDMTGMRDRLIHFYFSIKYDIIWNTVKNDISRVKLLIKRILKDMEK